jgi:mono/diheme cytochrome c family protein
VGVELAIAPSPLGDVKAGLSADLDALAAYVGSLNAFDVSPNRPGASTLSAAAADGRLAFMANNCAACHNGNAFTRSAIDNPADVGTIKTTSGQRLYGTLTGIDVPTLRDVWATAPYLHDGSAATLEAAITAHTTLSVPVADVPQLAAYLREIGSDEGPAPVADTTPPTVTATSPSSGATGIGRSTNISATFSEAMDPATIGTATFELRGPGNVLLAATVTWSATNGRATLNPNSRLAASTPYTVTVRGGASGAKDMAGNALAANRVWSFTTR